jgi:hypothetical protein
MGNTLARPDNKVDNNEVATHLSRSEEELLEKLLRDALK